MKKMFFFLLLSLVTGLPLLADDVTAGKVFKDMVFLNGNKNLEMYFQVWNVEQHEAVVGVYLDHEEIDWDNDAVLDEFANRGLMSAIDPSVSGEVEIPDTVEHNGEKWVVTRIMDEAFIDCENLTKIVLPNTVKQIERYAFSNCTSLLTINIPAGITIIDSWFSGNSSLNNIIIPEGVTTIKSGAFGNCTSLLSLELPSTVISIGAAFSGCTNLTSVNIPAAVTSIGTGLFKGCENLTTLTLHDGITSIGDEAFFGCKKLVLTSLPANLKTLGRNAFAGCSKLTNLYIPSGMTVLYDNTFANCTSLTSMTIPTNIQEIQYSAFEGCTGLTEVTIPSSIKSLANNVFSGCTNLSKVLFDECRPTSISSSAFAGCTAISEVIFPVSVYQRIASVEEFKGKTLHPYLTAEHDTVSFSLPMKIDLSSTQKIGATDYVGTPSNDMKALICKEYFYNTEDSVGTVQVEELNGGILASGEGILMVYDHANIGNRYMLTSSNSIDTISVTGNLLRGVSVDTEIGADGRDFVLYNGKFLKANQGVLPAGKCYLRVPEILASAKSIVFSYEEDRLTDLKSVEKNIDITNSRSNIYYDLSGRRVMNPTRGLYIVNGKKVIF